MSQFYFGCAMFVSGWFAHATYRLAKVIVEYHWVMWQNG